MYIQRKIKQLFIIGTMMCSCFYFSALQLMGQQLPFLFETLPQRSDISQSTINAMLQDQQGYIWFGTWSGLWRYDAYNFRHFSHESGLNSSKITCLFEESDGTLWVATRNTGLYRYDKGQEIFQPASQYFPSGNALKAQNITSVFKDRDGRYWIGAEEGLSMFDPGQNRFFDIPLPSITPPPSENSYLYSICQTTDGSIWVGGSHGLYRAAAFVNTAPGALPLFQQIPLHPEDATAIGVEYHNFIYTVRQAQNQANTLWIGSKQGLKILDISAGFLSEQKPLPGKIRYFEHQEFNTKGLSHNFVVDVCEGDFPIKNAVWVATFNGLNLFDSNTGQFQQFYANDASEGSLQANNIKSLMFDRTGMFWVGTNRGVNKINPHYADFSLHTLRKNQRTADESISYLTQSSENIWIGSFGGGIFRVPMRGGIPQWSEYKRYSLSSHFQTPVTDFISAIIPDGRGYLWCITQGAGAFRFKEKDAPPNGGILSKAEQFTKGSGPLNTGDNYLMTGLVSQRGPVWLGCWDAGLNLYDPVHHRLFQFNKTSDGKADFHLFPIVSLVEMSAEGQQQLLVGTRGGGLFQLAYDDQSQTLNLVRRIHRDGTGADHMPGNFITSILPDEHGHIWVTTESGLFLKEKNQASFKAIHLKNFPQSSHYEAIISSGNGQFWISTQKGIGSFRLNGQEITHAVFYESRNGLRERFFNSGAVLRLSTGALLFGGSIGVTSFHPQAVQPDEHVPASVLTGLRLFNRAVYPGIQTSEHFLLEKSLAFLPQLTLSHLDNVVSFEFSALHFVCPEQNAFAYKLEGFDPDWIYTDASQRLAHYTNLPAGEYKFLVKSANSDGIWNPQAAQLAVKVLPPWWRSAWAYTLYAVAFLGILWGVRQLTLIRANYENKIKLERLEKQKLEEVNQLKLIFFTNISHELKTPLTLIISPLEEIIRSRSADNNRLHHTFSMMHRNAVRLLTMINQLLDIRKAEAGLMKLEVGEGNLVQFVGEVFLSFRELAQQRQCHFEFKAEKPQIKAWFDPDQLEKVFFNILSNAFKFTPPGGQILVSVGIEKEQLFVRVSDNGRGIPEEKRPFIFERFFRAVDHPDEEDAGGTGIGLSLVKSIIEQHHGSVEVESQPGQGAIFTVWLPQGNANFAEHEKKRPTIHAEEVSHYMPYNPDSTLPENVANTPPQEKPLLLLVEDNADIRNYLLNSFEKEYTVLEASNGQEGLDKTLEMLPDLILCDISMPGMDGLELTRQLKSRMETSHIPIILLTARTALIFKIDGLEIGADDYITKPFNLQLLQIRIRNLIESRRQLREKFERNMSRLETLPTDMPFQEIDEQFLQSVDKIIDLHLQDPDFSVDDLAQQLFLNRKQVYRKIKALTNQTPNDYIRSIRLKRAAQLLRTQRYTIAEVTYKVGFQDLKYFRERFKAFFGVNPSEIDP